MSLDLFDLKNESGSNVPLAARMRPRDLDGFIGQESLLARRASRSAAALNRAMSAP